MFGVKMKSKLFVGLGAALCTIGLVALPTAANATVDLYENAHLGDWNGDLWTASSSSYNVGSYWHDKISSLWVWNPVDYVTLYENAGYGGLHLSFVNGTDDLGSYGYAFGDDTDSFIIVNI